MSPMKTAPAPQTPIKSQANTRADRCVGPNAKSLDAGADADADAEAEADEYECEYDDDDYCDSKAERSSARLEISIESSSVDDDESSATRAGPNQSSGGRIRRLVCLRQIDNARLGFSLRGGK